MKKLSKLHDDEMTIIQKDKEILSFPNDFDLVYEKQIPNVGVALITGAIELTKKSKVLDIIVPGCILGVHQLINEEPLQHGWKIKKDSKIIFFGKAELLEALNDSRSKLYPIINKIIRKK